MRVETKVDLPNRVRNRGADTLVRGVRVFSWNPRPSIIRKPIVHRVTLPNRINNFGDLLGPVIVDQLLEEGGVGSATASSRRTLFAIGSVLHFARDGDVVWGTGINGKMMHLMPERPQLDVRAVRGPETRRELMRRGVEVPEVYGDPALLLPELFPDIRAAADTKVRKTLIAPNLNEYRALAGRVDVLNPRDSLSECVRRIAESERVVGSSLHALIVAEALGIPAVPVASGVEHPLKYDDYYGGTGRSGTRPAPDIDAALSGRFAVAPLDWDSAPLRAAFPTELWGRQAA